MSRDKQINQSAWKVKLAGGHETPSPKYRYQVYSGKSEKLSAKQDVASQKRFVELQNLHF